MSESQPSVLVTDPISEEGLALLRKGSLVDVAVGLSPEAIIERIPDFDGLIVRSETKVTRSIIEHAGQLRVIGRAGMGVDNIDLDAANERGIVVVNAPGGNTIAAAEQTVALMFAIARNTPAAVASLSRGEWKRSQFLGTELRGKTLGVIGFGRIGYEVASIARLGLHMNVLAHDPIAPASRAAELGVKLVSLDEVLAGADIVTLHAPLIPETRTMCDAAFLSKMKPGAWLINVARGALVDESALLAALESGHLAKAGLDVFATEPPDMASPLLSHPSVVATPHLGASTKEAQLAVAVDVADQVVRFLHGEPPKTAVNLPAVDPSEFAKLATSLLLAERLGAVAAMLAGGDLHTIEISYENALAPLSTLAYLTAEVIRSVIGSFTEDRITAVNAGHVAAAHGITVREERDLEGTDAAVSSMTVVCHGAQTVRVAGRTAHGRARLTAIDEFGIDADAEDTLLITRHDDTKGIIATATDRLAHADINIAAMSVGRHAPHGSAMMLVALDDVPASALVAEIAAIPAVHGAWCVPSRPAVR